MNGIVSQLIELISPPLLLLNAQFNRMISIRFYYVLILNCFIIIFFIFPWVIVSVHNIIQFTLCT